MTRPFDRFVLLAGMRTGSNLLEATLNTLPGLTCHGEAFNPAMIGYPKSESLLGMTLADRDADPHALLARMAEAPGLNGFRYFHDHDPRIFDTVMRDPRCAKIVLTRNPAESWVSLQIARTTGQWKLGDGRRRKEAQAMFDAPGFEAHLAAAQAFQVQILHLVQVTGQTAFYLDYEDLQDRAVLAGLAAWLGFADAELGKPAGLVPQNPEEIAAKVENFAEMEAALARLDRFNLSRTPSFEPRRGPNVPSFVGADGPGLLYMPVRGAADAAVRAWMETLDPAPLTAGFAQKTLRQWMRARPGHRRLTVVRHPLARAHRAFTDTILKGAFPEIRAIVQNRYKVKMPPVERAARIKPDAFREAFGGFLVFLRANLNSQTPVRVDPFWASQAETILGFGQYAPPDLVLREAELPAALPQLATRLGLPAAPFAPIDEGDIIPLAEVYDDELEQAARQAYPRDFLLFGFPDWAP